MGVPSSFQINEHFQWCTDYSSQHLDFVVLTGHIQAGYCKECKVNLEPNCSLEEHQRSRKHINRLLQLGIELPMSCVNQTQENQLPEGDVVSVIFGC